MLGWRRRRARRLHRRPGRAGDFVAEVDVAGGVDEVQCVRQRLAAICCVASSATHSTYVCVRSVALLAVALHLISQSLA
jgi:hypothetical protein